MSNFTVNSIKEDINCPVCLEVFKEPKLLPCGHSLCCGCLEQILREGRNDRLRCPVDRKMTAISNHRLSPKELSKTFKTNVVLEEIVQVVVNNEKKCQRVKCETHRDKRVEYFCMKCQVLICNTCAFEQHNEGECRFEPFDRAVRLLNKDINDLCKNFDKQRRNALNVRQFADVNTFKQSTKLSIKILAAQNKLKDVYEKLTTELGELSEELSDIRASGQNMMKKAQKVITEMNQRYEEFSDYSADARITVDALDTLVKYKSLTEFVSASEKEIQSISSKQVDFKPCEQRVGIVEKLLGDMQAGLEQI